MLHSVLVIQLRIWWSSSSTSVLKMIKWPAEILGKVQQKKNKENFKFVKDIDANLFHILFFYSGVEIIIIRIKIITCMSLFGRE